MISKYSSSIPTENLAPQIRCAVNYEISTVLQRPCMKNNIVFHYNVILVIF